MKFHPWSDRITSVKKLISAFATFLVEIFLSGIASGYLDNAHVIISKYLLPYLFCRGPDVYVLLN